MSLAAICYVIVVIYGGGLQAAQEKPILFTNFGMLRGIAGMSLGCFLYKNEEKLSFVFNTMPRNFMQFIVLAIFSGICVLQCIGYKRSGGLFAVFLIIPLFASRYFDRNKIWVTEILGNRFCVWLGKISFALYLAHTPVIIFLGPRDYITKFGIYGAFFCTFLFSVLFSVIRGVLAQKITNFLNRK